MSTLLKIKTAVASNLELSLTDLTVNSQDMFLFAANQVRRQAVMGHDFEFNRRLVQLTVNGVTGGSLDDAVLYGTATSVVVNTILAVGTFDTDGNLRPVEWTTTTEGLIRQYEEQPSFVPRYPRDGDALARGQSRFVFSGSSVFFFPRATAGSADTYTLGLEVYADQTDWDEDLSVEDTWTTYGEQYITWATVVQLNKRFKYFVARTEGNLAPPEDLAAAGLASLIDWDVARFEQARRHGR